MSKAMGWLAMLALACAILASTAQAAFSLNSNQAFNTSADLHRKMVLTIDFGATTHVETFTLTCSYTTTAGARWTILDIDRMASAPNTTEWNNGYRIFSFATPGAGGGTSSPAPTYVTPAYAGVHTFVIEYSWQDDAGTFPDTVTVVVDNGAGAATGTTANSAKDDALSIGIGQSAGSGGYFASFLAAGHMEALLDVASDQIQFNYDINFGATPVACKMSLYGFNFTAAQAGTSGTGPMTASFYDMDVGGGSLAQGTITVADGGEAITPAYTTPAYSGIHKFRVVMKAGPAMTGDKLGLFYFTFQTPARMSQVPASPDTAVAPVTITPSSKIITSSQLLTASGGSGTPSYTWSQQGTWPAGVSLTPTTGNTSTIQISTAPANGTMVTVRATNGTTGEFREETYTINAAGSGALTIASPTAGTALPSGVQSTAYIGVTFTATGGTLPHTWSATGLPAGLTLSSTGDLTGTPSVNGAFNSIVVTVTGGGTVNGNYTMTVSPTGTLTIITVTVPNGTLSTPYAANITAQGGTGTYNWQLGPMSTLPPGLTLGAVSSATCVISGSPTATGSYPFTIQVSDGTNNSTANFTIVVSISGGGGGTFTGGGGGGGGGCAATSSGDATWALLAALGLMAAAAVLGRRKAA